MAESVARELREAQARLHAAQHQTEAIDRAAAELARELPAGGLYLRLSWVFRREHD